MYPEASSHSGDQPRVPNGILDAGGPAVEPDLLERARRHVRLLALQVG